MANRKFNDNVRNSRDSSRVPPIRIGGPNRSPAVSMDADNDGRRIVLEDPEPMTRAAVDWNRLEGELALTPIEQAVFGAHWRRGVPRYRLPRELGITPSRASAVCGAVLVKLRSVPAARSCFGLEPIQHSRAPLYREHIRPGQRCYSLSALDQTFLEIMQQEKYSALISQRDPSEIRKPRVFQARTAGSIFLTLEKLHEQAKLEGAKRDRIGERAHSARIALEESERALEDLVEAGKTSEAEAVLAEKPWPSEAHERKLTAARSKIGTATATLAAARVALDKQAEIVGKIEAEIEARRHEAFLREFDPAKAKMLSLMSEFAEACNEVRTISARHGLDGYRLAFELFPYAGDEAMGDTERSGRLGVINAIGQLSYNLAYGFQRAV